jgi:hypothetical protein
MATSGFPTLTLRSISRRIKSRYFVKLVDALRALRPQQFAEARYEHEFTMEPRRASEISDASKS